jgi:COP9 signalosome complex subunit 7
VLRYGDIAGLIDMPAANVRELEDLIIDCIYNELLNGKLDQLNEQFHVVSVYGRDLRPSDIESALAKLEAWDKQLQQTQTLFENNIVKKCNQSVLDNVSRQAKENADLKKRREEVLEELSKGEKKVKTGGPQGAAFLQGLIPGFLNR